LIVTFTLTVKLCGDVRVTVVEYVPPGARVSHGDTADAVIVAGAPGPGLPLGELKLIHVGRLTAGLVGDIVKGVPPTAAEATERVASVDDGV
jgi:hypothetical protein